MSEIENVKHDYNENNIQVLEGLEAVEKGLVCILEVHLQEDCIILYMK